MSDNGQDTKHAAEIVVAGLRLLLSAALIFAAVWVSALAGDGVQSLVAEAEALKWVTAAATTMAGAAIVIAVQSLPDFLGALPRFARSLPESDWPEYAAACWGVIKPLIAPSVIIAFAAVFVAEEAQRVVPVKPDYDTLARKMAAPILDEVAKLPDRLADRVGDAMSDHGYTTERGDLLENLRLLDTSGGAYHFARFAVLFSTARLADGTTPENLDLNDVRFRDGVVIDDAGLTLVDRIINAMSPCGRTRKIELTVEGYASSEPFAGFEAQSDDLNVEVANQRGRNLRTAIENAVGDTDMQDRFQIELVTYRSLAEMESVRGFNDRPLGVASMRALAQDVMTRAAHIKIAHAGDCAIGA